MSGLSANRNLVEEFYFKVWNGGDEDVARRILALELQFRGSTGLAKRGVEEFLSYVRLIQGALNDYECVIEDLVSEGDRCFAKMLFRGIHNGSFFGVAPTGNPISWAGAALFRFSKGHISDIWVLGDIDGLKRQLGLAKDVAP